jgi:hypothetical protein
VALAKSIGEVSMALCVAMAKKTIAKDGRIRIE